MGNKVVVTKSKLDLLADSVSAKSGESLPLTIGEMKVAVDSIVLNSQIIGDGELDVDENDYLYFDDDGEGGSGTAAISVVDTIDSNGGTVRTITALDISDTTAAASDVAQGKYFYTADGIKTIGTKNNDLDLKWITEIEEITIGENSVVNAQEAKEYFASYQNYVVLLLKETYTTSNQLIAFFNNGSNGLRWRNNSIGTFAITTAYDVILVPGTHYYVIKY